MDTYDPRRKRGSRARARYEARRGKDEEAGPRAMATPRESAAPPRQSARAERIRLTRELPEPVAQALSQAGAALRDAWWYATHRPDIARALLVASLAVLLLFAGSRVLAGRIFPNVYALGVPLDGLTVEEATIALVNAWNDDLRVELRADGEALLSVAPAELGLRLDAVAAAEAARGVGLSGVPFGVQIDVAVTLERAVAEDLLLAQAPQVNRLPYNAGYALRAGQVVGVPGQAGREIDIAVTLDRLASNPAEVIRAGRLDVFTLPLAPDFVDPEPLLEDAAVYGTAPFQLTGYDPFRDESVIWAAQPEVVVGWLEAGPGRLRVRETAFRDFVEQLNALVGQADSQRFIAYDDALDSVQDALERGSDGVYVRMRQRDQVYTIERGDFGYRLARRFGIPFYLIQEANPGKNFDELFVGDTINLPSPDVVLPQTPVAHKRIVVDLDRQYLVAFENGQEVFHWAISSGSESYPTYPGTFQILTHEEEAYGSSFSLCAEGGGTCGQWTMYWFMGIYEVAPELMNGFHGAVLLPNGGYLNGGSVGNPATFGCVMSVNDQAQLLYEWAEVGTMVEIISSEYAPRSALAQQVKNRDLSTFGAPASNQAAARVASSGL